MLVRSCLKSCMLGFSIIWTKNFQMSRLGLRRKEELETKLPRFTGLSRKQGNFRKTSTSVPLTKLKPLFESWQTVESSYRWEYQSILSVSWETCLQVKKQQLVSCMDWLKIEKVQQGCLRSPCLFNLHHEKWAHHEKSRAGELQARNQLYFKKSIYKAIIDKNILMVWRL